MVMLELLWHEDRPWLLSSKSSAYSDLLFCLKNIPTVIPVSKPPEDGVPVLWLLLCSVMLHETNHIFETKRRTLGRSHSYCLLSLSHFRFTSLPLMGLPIYPFPTAGKDYIILAKQKDVCQTQKLNLILSNQYLSEVDLQS